MKWKIILMPQVVTQDPEVLVLAVAGATLSIGGEVLDLSFMQIGDVLPEGAIDHPLLDRSEIRCTSDGVEISRLVFQISADQTDLAACFPEPVIVNNDGPIPLPSQFPSALKAQITESEITPDAEQH